MKLTYFSGAAPNFGDALNPYLWPKLLPQGFLDRDESELFLGIGSILWEHHPKASRKVVMGSGYGGYAAAPDIHDGTWEIGFVRGPRTAEKLGIAPEKAICDSAVLLRAIKLPPAAPDVGVGFMPHYHSLSRADWGEVCRLAGVRMIDPRHDVETVIAQIRGASMLITEAMHGAIVADALRTPWLAVSPVHPENRSKWLDWSDSLGLELKPRPLRPASLLELYIARTGGRRYYEGRATDWSRGAVARPMNRALVGLAAAHLRSLSRCEPQLSRDERIAEATERALDAVDRFVRSRLRANAGALP
jgi:succinoglycan biosynthesis protein ExoV